LRSRQDRECQKRNVTDVVVTTLRFLGRAKNVNAAKVAEPPKGVEPINESDNPFNEAEGESREQRAGNPF
jgi:hypothetical protein